MSDPWSARQQCHLAYVAEYTSEIRHMPGTDNVVTDSLSGPPVVAVQPPAVAAVVPPALTGLLSWNEVVANQIMCSETQAVLSSSLLQLQQITIQAAEVWCDLSTGSIRLLQSSLRARAPSLPCGHAGHH